MRTLVLLPSLMLACSGQPESAEPPTSPYEEPAGTGGGREATAGADTGGQAGETSTPIAGTGATSAGSTSIGGAGAGGQAGMPIAGASSSSGASGSSGTSAGTPSNGGSAGQAGEAGMAGASAGMNAAGSGGTTNMGGQAGEASMAGSGGVAGAEPDPKPRCLLYRPVPFEDECVIQAIDGCYDVFEVVIPAGACMWTSRQSLHDGCSAVDEQGSTTPAPLSQSCTAKCAGNTPITVRISFRGFVEQWIALSHGNPMCWDIPSQSYSVKCDPCQQPPRQDESYKCSGGSCVPWCRGQQIQSLPELAPSETC